MMLEWVDYSVLRKYRITVCGARGSDYSLSSRWVDCSVLKGWIYYSVLRV